jgi:hypothetical protein
MTAVSHTRPRSSARLPMTSGRVVTLAIGVPVLLALIGAVALSLVGAVGQATFPVHDTIPVTGGQVTALIDSGNITLRQTPSTAARAELTGTARYTLVRSTFTASGSTVNYTCPLHIGNCSLDGTLQVPERAAVSLYTFGGDVTVPDFSGSPLSLNTDGGNVNAGDLATGVDLTTAGGDVTAGALAGPLNANTEGGNVNIASMTASDVAVSSGGGDVSLAYASQSLAPRDVHITTYGGNVTLYLPPGQYQVTEILNGGTPGHTVANDPTAKNSIYVSSGGGDINIYD